MRRKVIIFTALPFFLGLCIAAYSMKNDIYARLTGQLSQKKKVADFVYMYNILTDNYPYFEINKRQYKTDWLSNKDEYIEQIKTTTTDEAFFNILNKILEDLHSPHACMFDKQQYFEEKKIYEENKNVSEAWVKQFNNKNSIERYSKTKTVNTDSSSAVNNLGNENVTTSIIEKSKVAYLGILSFASGNINKDMKTIEPFLNEIKDYKALIIDIRGNGGGDSRYWREGIVSRLISKSLAFNEYSAIRGGSFTESFIKSSYGVGYDKLNPISNIDNENLEYITPELRSQFKYYYKNVTYIKPENPVGFKGKIYLLVDGSVFSSAEGFAAFSKSTGFAVTIGSRTKGDGIGSDPAVCVLPNSGYMFSFPKEMGLNPDGIPNAEYGTVPDILVDPKKGLNISDDAAIQKVLKISI